MPPARKPKAKLRLTESRHLASRGNEPEPPVEAPELPFNLGEHGETFARWCEILGRTPGLVTINDGLSVAMGVAAIAEWLESRETIKREGFTVPDRQGGVRAHPAVRQERLAYDRIRDFIRDFGLSPAERAKLELPSREDDRPSRDLEMFGA